MSDKREQVCWNGLLEKDSGAHSRAVLLDQQLSLGQQAWSTRNVPTPYKKGGAGVITLLNCNWKYSFKFSQSKGLRPLSFIIFVRQPKVTSLRRKTDFRLVFVL